MIARRTLEKLTIRAQVKPSQAQVQVSKKEFAKNDAQASKKEFAKNDAQAQEQRKADLAQALWF